MVRFKNRYFLFEVIFEDDKIEKEPSLNTLLLTIRSSIEFNFGDFGLASTLSSLNIKYWDNLTNVGILRASRDSFKLVWASLTLINFINKRSAMIKISHISGTIRSCQKKAIKLHKKKIGNHTINSINNNNTSSSTIQLSKIIGLNITPRDYLEKSISQILSLDS